MKTKKLVCLGLGAAMLFSMPFGVLAAGTGGTVDVEGSIVLNDPTVGPGPGAYDVTIPALAQWSVTGASRPDVVSGVDNEIKNNSEANIVVTFERFEQNLANNNHAKLIEDDLELYLAGDLDEVTANLAKGYISSINVGTLASKGEMKFGFTGEYTGKITNSTNYSPEYQMTLGFALQP